MANENTIEVKESFIEIFQDSKSDYMVYEDGQPVGMFLEGDPELERYRKLA